MKYIVTEEQFKTAEKAIKDRILEKTIIDFFEKNLTPFDGWDSHENYEKAVAESDEFFFGLTDDDDWNMAKDNHMWYSLCHNHNLSNPLPEGHCPVVTLPPSTYEALNAYFGEKWKKLFRRWFITHTGLFVVQIDTL